MSRNVSALMQPMMPQKCKDPEIFTIPCTIGESKFENAMLDLGASINVMPTSIFNSLALGPLQNTGVVIQLANRSNAHPAGLVEDVLVKVNNLVFPADFYILDMEGETQSSRAPIILGRPFLRTARTKIDVYTGTLSMEFGDSIVQFDIFNATMKHPVEEHSLFQIEVLADLVEDTHCMVMPVNVTNDVATLQASDVTPCTKILPSIEQSQRRLNPLKKEVVKKKKIKRFHVFHSRLKIMAGKLRSKWIDPFVATSTFPYDAKGIKSEATSEAFKVKVNGLKLFRESPALEEDTVEELHLKKPP